MLYTGGNGSLLSSSNSFGDPYTVSPVYMLVCMTVSIDGYMGTAVGESKHIQICGTGMYPQKSKQLTPADECLS